MDRQGPTQSETDNQPLTQKIREEMKGIIQQTLLGNAAGTGTLDMTSGLRGMQNELHEWAGINIDASRFRRVDIRADFTKLPFKDGAFSKILFDPPHVLDQRNTLLGTVNPTGGLGPVLATWKYGSYRNVDQLRKALYAGSREAYRVLEDRGILIFKWSDAEKSFNWALSSIEKRFATDL